MTRFSRGQSMEDLPEAYDLELGHTTPKKRRASASYLRAAAVAPLVDPKLISTEPKGHSPSQRQHRSGRVRTAVRLCWTTALVGTVLLGTYAVGDVLLRIELPDGGDESDGHHAHSYGDWAREHLHEASGRSRKLSYITTNMGDLEHDSISSMFTFSQVHSPVDSCSDNAIEPLKATSAGLAPYVERTQAVGTLSHLSSSTVADAPQPMQVYEHWVACVHRKYFNEQVIVNITASPLTPDQDLHVPSIYVSLSIERPTAQKYQWSANSRHRSSVILKIASLLRDTNEEDANVGLVLSPKEYIRIYIGVGATFYDSTHRRAFRSTRLQAGSAPLESLPFRLDLTVSHAKAFH